MTNQEELNFRPNDRNTFFNKMTETLTTQSGNSMIVEMLDDKMGDLHDMVENETLTKVCEASGIAQEDVYCHKIKVNAPEIQVPKKDEGKADHRHITGN